MYLILILWAFVLCRDVLCRLSDCLITEEGCTSLASALNANFSRLRELDLSNNHPGDSGVMLLSAGLDYPYLKLDTTRYGEPNLTRLHQYFCLCSYF